MTAIDNNNNLTTLKGHMLSINLDPETANGIEKVKQTFGWEGLITLVKAIRSLAICNSKLSLIFNPKIQQFTILNSSAIDVRVIRDNLAKNKYLYWRPHFTEIEGNKKIKFVEVKNTSEKQSDRSEKSRLDLETPEGIEAVHKAFEFEGLATLMKVIKTVALCCPNLTFSFDPRTRHFTMQNDSEIDLEKLKKNFEKDKYQNWFPSVFTIDEEKKICFGAYKWYENDFGEEKTNKSFDSRFAT